MDIKRGCYNCSGNGEVNLGPAIGGGEDQIIECSVCLGVGTLVFGAIDELDALAGTVNEILGECSEILDKCNEILEKVDV